jgi:uncharacterized protein GlcG (DUF336 family)
MIKLHALAVIISLSTLSHLAVAAADPLPTETLYGVHMVIDGGGVPIKAGNEVIGGIGVGGTPEGDQDEACAKAGLAKIGNRVN